MRNAVVVLFCSSLLYACSGPMGPIPGGKLEGTPAGWPEDWAFTDTIENVLLQTNPNDPYSVTVWCVTQDGQLYIAAGNEESRWVLNMRENPEVVLSINGKLYEARVEDVTDREEINQVIAAYLLKYKIESEEDFVQEDGVLFRLHQT
jgi:uncharacterized protein DUF2255